MVLKVETSLEGLVTMRAGKRPNVIVDRVNVSCQPALLGEVLSTEFTTDLSTNAMGAKVVAKGVSVGVTLLAHVADQVLSLEDGYVRLMSKSAWKVIGFIKEKGIGHMQKVIT